VGLLRSRPPTNDAPPEDPGGSDAVLVAQAKQGDARAFALLYNRYLDQVYDFAAHRLESREAAEDATQTTFLRAIASLKECRDERVFAGWLFAIARNVIADSYRARRHATPPLPLDGAPEIEDPAATPEDLALQAAWERELDDARQHCLNPGERELLDLRLQGLSDREIATALGRGYGAIRTAQHRLIQKLRECLGVLVRAKEAAHVDA
jgi:RNA polymerase sigma-70 factor (ECF subfamily)